MTFNSPLFKLPNTFRAFYGAFHTLQAAQHEAITPILEGKDLILQSATGTGKSEAVLAPCIERVIQSNREATLLYIIPTRALAVDLKRRFEPIIKERLGLNLSIRTGDVKQSKGSRPDIMFTTPESLDVMLGSTNQTIRTFLNCVGCVIIDEVYPLIYTYRGVHLDHLIIRLERRNVLSSKKYRHIQRIAMSATIADVNNLIDAFNFLPIPDTCYIQTAVNRDISAHLVHLKKEEVEFSAFLNDLHDKWNYNKILLFTNSRGACDRLFGIINKTGRFKGVSEIHYSNLKPAERKQTEERFLKKSRALCIATSTLELGIDIGDVDAVILYEPPDSVSAFLQRIGRANRRKKRLNFWGVCQGEGASIQVVRFLALLNLARQGIVESQTPKLLPSVIAQQIISCLYEKKQISLASVEDLFRNRATFLGKTAYSNSVVLSNLFESLEKKRWIKKSFVSGLYSGGLQYGKHLTEYKIWGNFPESEEDYSLELTTTTSPSIIRSIADIPVSIVRQINVEEKIDIAGRCLKIISINHDAKRILAVLAASKPDKEILWFGMGAHVSFEVAQMMQNILKNISNNQKQTEKNLNFNNDNEIEIDNHNKIGNDNHNEIDNDIMYDPSLLSRTRTLFEKEINKNKNGVTLDNGVEVILTPKFTYLYRTYLGSLGNLVLEWSIRNYIKNLELYDNGNNYENSSNIPKEEFYISSNEIEVECSKFIKFESLNLPADRKEFDRWVKINIKILSSLIPLNMFCKALPINLLITEVGDFLFDQQVVDRFNHYLSHTSEVVIGDTNYIQSASQNLSYFNGLERAEELSENNNLAGDKLPYALEITPKNSLLEQEKEIWSLKLNSTVRANLDISLFSIPCLEKRPDAAITATMVSDYFLYKQCKRRLCLKYLCIAPPAHNFTIDSDRERAIKQGFIHENNVLKSLENSGNKIINMNKQDFLETINRLTVEEHFKSNESKIFLFQSMLKIEINITDRFKISAVGVPDLIAVSINENSGKKQLIMKVGDIKSSVKPQYHHKWQVAFYTLLLKKIVNLHNIQAEVSSTGFLMTRSYASEQQNSVNRKEAFEYENSNDFYEHHTFGIKPFISALPILLKTIHTTLSKSVSKADYRLKSNCTLCEFFTHCYSEALTQEDIQFLPRLTDGELLKLRKIAIYSIEALHNSDTASLDFNAIFSSWQRKNLIGRCDAILNNRIILHKRKTRLFPINISAYFFIHIIKEPISQMLKGFGLLIMDNTFKIVETHIKVSQSDFNYGLAQFLDLIAQSYYSFTLNGNYPHIFYFGSQTSMAISDFINRDISILTDIKKIFTEHFYMPSPGCVSLFTLADTFRCNQGVERPASLFHSYYYRFFNIYDHNSENSNYKPELESEINSILTTMAELFKTVTPLLESQWTQECVQRIETLPESENLSKSTFIRFISNERRLKEEDTLDLQELPLHERMERFRALGYLVFSRIIIDNQRNALYIFNTTDKTMPSKFRKGDFVKLVPHDIIDSPHSIRDIQSISYNPYSISNIQDSCSVIISEYDMNKAEVSLISRSGKLNLSKKLFYSLEEDITDFTEAKLAHAAEFLFSESPLHPVNQLITGAWQYRQNVESVQWIQKFINSKNQGISFLNQELTLSSTGLNFSQIEALTLPFRYKTSLIQGPPGTGKTHLLAWILILLVMNAFERSIPLRIGISALTHQAVDNVLNKVVSIVNQWVSNKSKFSEESRFAGSPFPASCIKWGKFPNDNDSNGTAFKNNSINLQNNRDDSRKMVVEFSDDADDVLSRTWSIIGATGFGFYNLFNSRRGDFPEAFDWIIFDEASQVLIPYALLSLIYCKGNFLFLGDVHQLPPIVSGDYGSLNQSILSKLTALYPESHQLTLNITYRMNKEICQFPSRMWYNQKLHPALINADSRLQLKYLENSNRRFSDILEPSNPVVMVLVDHEGCSQQCDIEAELMASLVYELMKCHNFNEDQIGLISPHRAQNNNIIRRLGEMNLPLPLVDTVERTQGAERDIIIFGITSSDPDHISSEFLNSPNRLNVAITRARQKLIIIGSRAFFSAIPDNEAMLEKNSCFKELLAYCRKKGVIIDYHKIREQTDYEQV